MDSWLKTVCDKFKVTFINDFSGAVLCSLSVTDGTTTPVVLRYLLKNNALYFTMTTYSPTPAEIIKPIISTQHSTADRTKKRPHINNLVTVPINRNSFSDAKQTVINMALLWGCKQTKYPQKIWTIYFLLRPDWVQMHLPEACPPNYTFSSLSRKRKNWGLLQFTGRQ